MKQMIENWDGGNMVATMEVEPKKHPHMALYHRKMVKKKLSKKYY